MADPTNYEQFNERVSELVQVVNDALKAAYGLENISHGETLGFLAGLDNATQIPGLRSEIGDTTGLGPLADGLPLSGEANNATEPGAYSGGIGIGNKHPGSLDPIILALKNGIGGKVGQLGLDSRNDISQTPSLGYRFFTGSEWSDWVRLLHSKNILGNINNGAVIEKGHNANGYYTIFADGSTLVYTSLLIPDWTVSTTLSTPTPIDVSASPGNRRGATHSGFGGPGIINQGSIQSSRLTGTTFDVSISGNGDNSGNDNSKTISLFGWSAPAE